MAQELNAAQSSASPIDSIAIRPVGLDDWAGVRYVHATAFRMLGAGYFNPSELDGVSDAVRSQDYVDRLLQEDLHAAWLGGELVGTCGWTPADDTGALARITSVFVRPLLSRMGIGRRLVQAAEGRARAAGFERFSTRVTFNAVGFFERLGYDVTSYGVQAINAAQSLPVTYMRKRPQHAAQAGPGKGMATGTPPGPGAAGELSLTLENLLTPRDR